MNEIVFRSPIKIQAPIGSGAGDPVLTRDDVTGLVGKDNPGLSSSLASGNIFVGNVSNVATGVTPSGAISITTTGVTDITAGYITNSHINASANIALSKLASVTTNRALISDGSGKVSVSSATNTEVSYLSGVTSAIQTQINSKQATITGAATTIVSSNLTANRVIVSDGVGKVGISTINTTTLGYISNVTSDVQTQLNTRLVGNATSSTLQSPTGSQDQFTIVWDNATSQYTLKSVTAAGVPNGGTTGQYLAKNSGTNQDTSWQTLTAAKITDVTATATEINKLSGVTASTFEINTLVGASSNLQNQINTKLSNVLAQNAIYVGNALNVAVQLASGPDTYVLTSVGGTPQWQPPTGGGGGGSVTSVDVSGGGTGLLFSGGPITSTGIITMSGTLSASYGGTGLNSIGTANQLIRVNGAGTALEYFTPTPTGVTSVGISSTDLSVSGSPITSSGVITIDLNNQSVTYAKFQNIPGSKLLGRSSVSTGSMQEIAVGSGLNLDSGTGTLSTINNGTVTSVQVSGGSTGLSFSGGPITSSGTITMAGTLAPSNGGTGLTAIGTSLQMLRVNSGATALEYFNPNITLSLGTSGTDVNFASTPVAPGGTITLNVPDASTTARGVITAGTQNIGGIKNFSVTATGTTSTYSFVPSITATANSQRMTAVDINPTFANGGFTNTINQGLVVRSGRVGLGTASPASSLHVVGSGTTASTSTFLLQDSTAVNLLEMLDDGGLRFGNTGTRPQLSPANASGVTSKTGSSMLYNTVASIGHFFSSGTVTTTTASSTEVMRFIGGLTLSTGPAVNYTCLNFIPTINQTGTASGDIYGIVFNPILTSVTGSVYGVNMVPSTSKNGFALGLSGGNPVIPTAKVHVGAGTATAGSAPIKLTTGTALTTPEDGALEYHGSHLYFTIGSTRYQLDQQAGGGGSGTVTSVQVSGGSTGLSFSGGPITTSGTITMAGTLAVANGGTGLTSLGSALQSIRVNSGGTALEYYTPAGGGGVTNTAAANEIAKSDGTNIVPSGIFSTTTSDLVLGSASIAGGNRVLSASSSASSANLILRAKAASVFIGGSVFTYLGEATDSGSQRGLAVVGSQTDIGLQFSTKNAGIFQFSSTTVSSATLNIDTTSTTESKIGPVDLGATAGNGFGLTLTAGTAGTASGNGNGGGIVIQTGQRRTAGTGKDGNIVIDPRQGWIELVNSSSTPTTSTDRAAMYSQDITAGNAAPFFRTEAGHVVKLYTTNSGSAYSITNGTTDRSYDANSTSLDEIADVLYTLIQDLKNTGLIA